MKFTDKEREYLPKIRATLKYGFFDKTTPNMLQGLICLFLAIILTLATVFIWLICRNQIVSPQYLSNFILSLIGVVLVALLLAWAIVASLMKSNKTIREILSWIEDAVEVQADAKSVQDEKGPDFRKLQIEFEISGELHILCGEDSRVDEWTPFIDRYNDKQIKILYSPKFNEVIILKSNIIYN